MEISVIASGSNGNCCLVEDKDSSIMIDAGKSMLEIETRLNKLGKSMENVDAILLTHAHQDHISGAGVLSRRYNIPLYMTNEVFSKARNKLGNITMKKFSVENSFKINNLSIKPISTSHNTSSCGFVIGKFGLFTDTGKITPQMNSIMPKLNAVLLESNHDVDMLVNGRYPAFLKKWILSDQGHLSNEHASNFIQTRGKKLSLALLGHLSENNNTPQIARRTFENLVKRKIEYSILSRDQLSGSWKI